MIERLKVFFLFLVYLILYLPLLVIVLYSFNDASYSMLIKRFSLKWYYAAFDNLALWTSVFNSFILAFCNSTLSTGLACILAINLHFYLVNNRNLLQQLSFLLIVIPDIILAVGLLLLFSIVKIKLGFITLLLAHITFSFPFALLIIQNRLRRIDKNLLLACKDLGGSDYYAFKQVIIPLLKTALLSAWLLCFTLSFDDVLVSYFTAGPSFQILPLYIYSLIRAGITPEINALCSIVILFSLLTISSAYLLMKRDKQ